MLRRIDLRSGAATGSSSNEVNLSPGALRELLPRANFDVDDAAAMVRPILDAVHRRGAAAVRQATESFDGVALGALRVSDAALTAAAAALEPRLRSALEEAIARVRQVHAGQRRSEHSTKVVPGGTVTQRWTPVRRVGLYVPGGGAAYPSSVIMNVVPAQLAGVESIAVTSPPQADTGLPHPLVLATCGLLGVDEVYAVGGAQAIGMLGYGVEECPPVDVITGPGNVWVTAAKRLLQGTVGIDSEAGPTEIAVLADSSADSAHVAADLVSQAEHDVLAASVLVTDSPELAADVAARLPGLVDATLHSQRVAQALRGPQSAVVLVDDIEAGVAVVNAYAAEHLEIQTRQARAVAATVHNAGAIFVGPYSPVSLGDYCAGSNHVLPTGGGARHSAALSVQTFLRAVQVVEYDAAALAQVSGDVLALAEAERLPAHGAAVQARFTQPPDGTDGSRIAAAERA